MSSIHSKLARERTIGCALERLDRLVRLETLEAPPQVLEQARELFDRSRKELGVDLAVVLDAYPRFALITRVHDARQRAWEERCAQCANWRGMFGLVDEDAEDDASKPWCVEYDFDGMTQPEPCPKFRLWEPN